MAVDIDKLRLMDAMTGEEITHINLCEPFRARFKNPYAVVHRGDLHDVLLKACRDSERIELRVNCEVVPYDRCTQTQISPSQKSLTQNFGQSRGQRIRRCIPRR
jgi:2-polyprenyl-6-methoxyphenol hydroxylase-like FAD-dependent oxidoreductase